MSKRGIARPGVSWDTLLGLSVGIVALLYLYHEWPHSVVYQLYGDAAHYNLSARVLLTKHFYTYWGHVPDAQVTPGYPLFLAVCYWVAGHLSHSADAGMHIVFLIQMLLAAATASVLFFVSRRALGYTFAVVVGLIWTFYPTTHGYYGLLLTEGLFVPLLCGFIWFLLIAMEQRKPLWWFISGLDLGLTALVRPTVMPLVVAAAIALALHVFGGKSGNAVVRLRQGVYLFVLHLIGFLIPLVPWWIRNWVVFHRLLLTDTDAGNPLLFGSDPNFQHDPTLGRGLTAAGQEHLAVTRALHGFATHPLAELKWYTLDKLGLLFGSPYLGSNPLFVHLQPVLVVLGAIGLALLFWEQGLRLVPWLALYLLVTQLPFLPLPRYAFPMMPLFFIGIAVALQWLVARLRKGGSRPVRRRRPRSEARSG